ncbi:disease resistance protein RGA5-like [Phragmites australis]|uniref:disease resistance protein RGA5-like n=1 Tax=Phragmites australis TaxID=29695 RepID=UPI002D778E86|nr:disease resistance protein RGA5-like [Phragmites australis]
MAAVMNSVMEKLADLMGEEYEKHKTMRRDMAFLRDELRSMDAVLKKLAEAEEELDLPTVEWRNQVMDMAFDIEDSIDGFIHQVGDDANTGDAGFIAKIRHYVSELRARHHFTNQIQELKTRVIQVSERRKRYKTDEGSSRSRCVAVDPRVTALYTDAGNLVGIDGPTDELISLLEERGCASLQCLRVVSIVGFGGLGKTTVANEVYRKLGGQYNFKAFVSVSQRPDLLKLLNRIISKVGMPQLNHTIEVEDLIENVREYLKDKRYFLVIDDIWDASVWEILRCAFPDNQRGSKVITTTRIETVAKACCAYRREFIYRMKHLDDQNSTKLFFSRVGYACAQPLIEIADEILQKCGGLPLAIISIASLLASQPARSREQWKFVCSSLSSNLRTNPTLEGMRQVLKLSYNNLPPHLKTCLLYIGMYPEDHSIEKEDLVRLWVAEGFVGKLHDQDAEEAAGSYFNELVNRSMIQPTYTNYNGEVLRCKVHDMILDLIRQKSEEENFLRVIDNIHDIATSLQSRVRRLSLHFGFGASQGPTAAASLSMSHIRSFALFGNTCFMPPISEFKYIRVLNLKDWRSDGDDSIDLTPICKLFELRYLNVSREARLPARIRSLKRLETLDLDKLDGDVPSDIVELPCLLHLLVPYGKRLPDGICAMKSLRTLRSFDVGVNSVDNFKGLGELMNVKDLWITCTGTVPQQGIKDVLWSSIGKLISCKLRALTFPHFGPVNLPPPVAESDCLTISLTESNLEILAVSSTMFPQVPSWIGQHHKLSELSLTVNVLTQDDVDLLAQLLNLYHLELNIRKSLKERILIHSGAVAFPVLKYFTLSCFAPWLIFDTGAMPNLQTLRLNHHGRGLKRYGRFILEGIAHLLNLKEVHVVIFNGYSNGKARPGTTVADAEATYRNAINEHPGQHSIKVEVTLFCLVLTPPAFIYDSDEGEVVEESQ